MRVRIIGATLLAIAGVALPVRAQMLHPGYANFGAPMSNFLSSSYLTQQVVNDQAFKQHSQQGAPSGGRVGGVPRPPLTFTPGTGKSIVPAKLAQAYPDAARKEAERLFTELLTKYADFERYYNIPRRDVSGAIASFIAGSYMAYHNIAVPDEHFRPLLAQMRQSVGGVTVMTKASDAQKQEMYEQMAIMGMFMAGAQMALNKQPNARTAGEMRKAAKSYLEAFLKTDADRILINAQGLSFR